MPHGVTLNPTFGKHSGKNNNGSHKQTMTARSRIARLSMIIALLAPSGPAVSQVVPGAAPRPEVLEIPGAPATPRSGIDIRLPGPAGAAVSLPPSVTARLFRITGLTQIPIDDANLVLAPWVGRSLTPNELLAAVEALSAFLRERDLPIAQALIPPQDFRNGIVEITVLEGRLGQLRMDTAADLRVRASVVERFTKSLRSGEPVRGDNLEQSLLLLNDLPGIRVEAALTAGAQAGSADLLVKVENDGHPLSAILTLDNAGLRATGEYRTDLNLRWRSPLGLGDLLALRLLASHTGGQKLSSLTYGLPVNDQGTRLGLRVSEQDYRLGREFAPLLAHGRQRALSLLVSHPLLRRATRNIYLSAAYSELNFSDRQDAVGAESDSRQRIASLGITADFRDGFAGGGVSVLQAQAYAGNTSLRTPVLAALDDAPGGLGVAGRYTVWRLRAQRVQAIDAQSSLTASVVAQTASRNLDAGSELAIGGPDAVRAYPAGELFADQGHITHLDYRRTLRIFDNAPTTISLFHDYARVEVNRSPLPTDTSNKRSYGGFGLGLVQPIGSNVTLQTSIAWRTTAQPLSEPDRRPRVWVALAARI